jgi:gas vesicle protein
MKSYSSFITGLIAGTALGGLLVLVCAPQSSRKLHEKIKSKFLALEKELDKIKVKAGQRSANVKDELKKKLSDLWAQIENLAREDSNT